MEYVAGGTFSNVSSFDITGFSSTYQEYSILINGTSVSAASNLLGVLYNGATQLNSQYYSGGAYGNYVAGTGAQFADNGASSFYIGRFDATYRGNTSLTFVDVDGSYPTWNIIGWDSNNFRGFSGGGYRNSTTSWDMIRVSGASANLTGQWRLYGYRVP
jgi:hypothetical protein